MWRAAAPALTLLLASTLAGCGADDAPTDGTVGEVTDDGGAAPDPDETTDDGDTTTEDAVPPQEVDPEDGPPAQDDGAADSDASLGAEIEVILAELEAEGIDPDDVVVTTTELVTWPDGALGCPEPGMMYTQALVEGYRIVVEVDGEEHTYHGATGDEPRRCEDPQPPVEGR